MHVPEPGVDQYRMIWRDAIELRTRRSGIVGDDGADATVDPSLLGRMRNRDFQCGQQFLPGGFGESER